MSTRAIICKKQSDGTYDGIYLHHDGYLEYAGKVLIENYDTEEAIDKLIALGDISVLGATIGVKTDFDHYCENLRNHKIEDQCLAYHRDREEDLNIRRDIDIKRTIQEFAFVYAFEDSQWYIRNEYGRQLLKDALVQHHIPFTEGKGPERPAPVKSHHMVTASTIGKLIDAFRTNDSQKFYSYADFIAQAYEDKGDKLGAKLIRDRIAGKHGPQITLQEFSEETPDKSDDGSLGL